MVAGKSPYKQHRDSGSKVKKINTMKIEEAMALAKADERVTDVSDSICWIMDRSEYWRSRGYEQIMQDVRDAVAKYNDMPTEEATS